MKVKLVSVGNDLKAAEIDVQLPATVGRGKKATLSLPHPSVSRQHCELYDRNGKLVVRDLGSLNGTYVGSQRIQESEVPLGELLTIATLNFRVVYGEPPAGSHPESPLVLSADDSTHGASDLPRVRNEATPSANKPPGPAPHPATREREIPVERDTEWQMGTTPPRDDGTDEEDLSSLLNGR
jgi:pSer/pThr/pTyr-binding forkhead associated (FHA) protein